MDIVFSENLDIYTSDLDLVYVNFASHIYPQNLNLSKYFATAELLPIFRKHFVCVITLYVQNFIFLDGNIKD
jgi:hypothetical protein